MSDKIKIVRHKKIMRQKQDYEKLFPNDVM